MRIQTACMAWWLGFSIAPKETVGTAVALSGHFKAEVASDRCEKVNTDHISEATANCVKEVELSPWDEELPKGFS